MAKRARLGFKLPTDWKAEAVTPRMTKGCELCGVAPVSLRLVHTVQGYPFPSSSSYCAKCAEGIMRKEEEQRHSDSIKRIDDFTRFLKAGT